MSDTTADAIPEGFEPVQVGVGFGDNLKPLYRSLSDGKLNFGLVVGPQHSNSMGICHGGALMTLADMATASWANMARGFFAGAPTVSLNIDFASAAKQGQWIETREEGVELKRLFGFSRGVIVSSRGVVARFSAVFYFPDHEGMSQDGLVIPGTVKDVLDRQ